MTQYESGVRESLLDVVLDRMNKAGKVRSSDSGMNFDCMRVPLQ